MENIKFKDIKVGDRVLLPKKITYGWHSSFQYWISSEVSRVTSAQFEVEGTKFWKKDGREVGTRGFDRVCIVGDKISWHNEPLKDQTNEYLEMLQKVKSINIIFSLCNELQRKSIPMLTEKGLEELTSLKQHLTEIIK